MSTFRDSTPSGGYQKDADGLEETLQVSLTACWTHVRLKVSQSLCVPARNVHRLQSYKTFQSRRSILDGHHLSGDVVRLTLYKDVTSHEAFLHNLKETQTKRKPDQVSKRNTNSRFVPPSVQTIFCTFSESWSFEVSLLPT